MLKSAATCLAVTSLPGIAATGKSLLTLSREWLGKPLAIEFAPWTRDPQGRYLGGNEMSMSPLEMGRFGEPYRLGPMMATGMAGSFDRWVITWPPMHGGTAGK